MRCYLIRLAQDLAEDSSTYGEQWLCHSRLVDLTYHLKPILGLKLILLCILLYISIAKP